MSLSEDYMIRRFGFLLLLLMFSILAACSREVESSAPSDTDVAAGTATALANLASLPPDIPIHDSAINLKLAAENTYISYQALGTPEDIVAYYRDALESQGWERRNNSIEEPIGGATTLLRSKTDKNISITIQSIPESEYVRILISVVLK